MCYPHITLSLSLTVCRANVVSHICRRDDSWNMSKKKKLKQKSDMEELQNGIHIVHFATHSITILAEILALEVLLLLAIQYDIHLPVNVWMNASPKTFIRRVLGTRYIHTHILSVDCIGLGNARSCVCLCVCHVFAIFVANELYQPSDNKVFTKSASSMQMRWLLTILIIFIFNFLSHSRSDISWPFPIKPIVYLFSFPL